MWNKGDRVLAQRLPEEFWYPGVIRHIQDDRFFVIYDDGEDGFVKAKQMVPLTFEIGDRVDVRQPVGKDYVAARIIDKQDNDVQVEFDHGGLAWLSLDKLRVQPAVWKKSESAAATPPEIREWSVGERVWACWFDLFWYPAVVLQDDEGQVNLLFDHGGLASVPADKIAPLAFAENEHIQCRWKGGNEFFPGEITGARGEVIDVRYDDGDEETTTIRLARLERDDWLPTLETPDLGGGDRVLGCWFDNFWYPGIILGVEGKRVHLLFDDNDQAFLTWDRVQPLQVEVGDRVFCRWKGGPVYHPAEIERKQNERIFVRYEDGREEWTSVRLIRLEK